jgi:RimJ/RimL family protein N-acetyltransferase
MAIVDPVEGLGFRLRCVEENDSLKILALRNDPQLSRYLPPLNVTDEQQRAWIAKQRERHMEYYFAVENRANNAFVGLSSLYSYADADGLRVIEWGRFVVHPTSFAAPETSLLTHQFAFEILELDEVFGYSVIINTAIQSFHRTSGLEDRGEAKVTYEIAGVTYPTRCWALNKANWPRFRDQMTPSVERAAVFAARA